MRESSSSKRVRLSESRGIRSQVSGLIAAAIEPAQLFSQVVVRGGMPSLLNLLDVPVKYRSAADLFCLDLYKEFDVNLLGALAAPAQVFQHYVDPAK